MTPCEHCQDQLLEYLYDLLEPEAQQSLRDHLEQCTGCQAALVQARRQQQLLAAAAKMEFAGVRFSPPPVSRRTADSSETPVLFRWARRPWVRWAVAASVLLAVGGLSIPGVGLYRAYTDTKRLAEKALDKQQHTLALARARTESASATERRVQGDIQKLRQDLQVRLLREENEKLAEAERERQANDLQVTVTGPQVVQPNVNYFIQTTNLEGKPVPADVTVELTDANRGNSVVDKLTVRSTGPGSNTAMVPPTAPLYPNTNLRLQVQATRGGTQVPVSAPVELPSRPVYLTHLATDKPLYQPGEWVHFRSLTLQRDNLQPPTEDLHIVFSITDSSPAHTEVLHLEGTPLLTDEKTGALILGPDKKPLRGVGAGEFWIDPDRFTGGEYALTVSESQNLFPPQQRKFRVSSYEVPRLDKKLEFAQKSYGPAQEVLATAHAARVEGGDLAGRRVKATITIDGQWYDAQGRGSPREQFLTNLQTDAAGKVQVRFKLPAQIERGDAALAVEFEDGGSVETIVRPIPLVLKKLRIEFFPEGGYLVPGVENRVYFQVRTPLDRPAELRGRIVDQDGQEIVKNVQTLNDATQPGVNQGMGRFSFTPAQGHSYRLQIDEPIGIEGRYELPPADKDKVVLAVPGGVFTEHEPIRAVVRSARQNRSFVVVAYCRGRLMDRQAVMLRQGHEAAVELKPAQDVGGVYRVTVFEQVSAPGVAAQLVPVSERLVYRAPAARLQLSVTPDRTQYLPRDHLSLSFACTDEKNQAVPAVVMATVVDRRVLTLADEKTARTMPTHFFLSTEVRDPEDLEYADFLLSEHPKAREALDLLLGTQGWRRFAEQDAGKFFKQNQQDEKTRRDAERLLVLNGQSPRNETTLVLEEQRRRGIQEQFRQQREQAANELAAKQLELQAERETRQRDLQRLAADADLARAEYGSATQTLEKYAEGLRGLRRIALPTFGVALGLLALVLLAVGIRRGLARSIPYFAASALCAALVVGTVAVTQLEPVGPGHDAPVLSMVNGEMERVANPGDDNKPETKEALKAEEDKGAPAPVNELREKLMKAAEPAPRVLDRPEGPAGFQNRAMPGPGGNVPVAPGAFGTRAGFGGGGFGGGRPGGMPQAAKMPALGLFREHAEAGKKQLNGLGRGGKDLAAQVRGLGPAQQQQLEAGLLGPQVAAGAEAAQVVRQSFVIREYAHHRDSTLPAETRSDFAETLYWQPALVLPDGRLDGVSFDLCDSVTTYRVVAFGHTLDGRLGAVSTEVQARLPFTLEPKLPLEVTAGDTLDVPVSIANNTPQARTVRLRTKPSGLALVSGQAEEPISLEPEQRTRRVYHFRPTITQGDAALEFEGEAKPFAADAVRKTVKVVPQGFPIVASHSDLLEGDARQEVVLPDTWLKGTLRCDVQVFPSTLADLQKGLEGLLREPGGCFEQTSSSNYPNLLILDYLKASDQAQPEVERRAREMLGRGYQRLTSFECGPEGKKQGYEWFGGLAPPHEALTAYGLLEFRDMARLTAVDPAMVERTRNYLLAQKDGQGGFTRNPRAIDSFGRAPANITSAYIVWALTESGKGDDVEKELAALAKEAKSSKDPYFLALVANSLLNRGKTADGLAALKKLAELQKDDGHLDAAQTSITGSGGRDLQIETTALSVLAWLKRPEFAPSVRKAVTWIGRQRSGAGGFGATQSTILTLKALIAFTQANKRTVQAGDLRLYVADQRVAALSFPAGTQDVLSLTAPEAEKLLQPGKNPLRIELTGGNVLPYTLSWSYQTEKPPTTEGCPVRLSTRLDRTRVAEGDLVNLRLTLENASPDKGQGMAAAIVGLPAGLTLPEDLRQLTELARLREDGQKPGLISAWELRGRELVLYWRDLAPGQKIEVPLQLTGRVPGEYAGPASRAYLYYNADLKCWVDPLRVTIRAKE
jgi:hypothetical protein